MLATAGGIGLVFPAPGTWGAVCGLAVAWAMSMTASTAVWWLLAIGLVAIGVPICDRAARQLGGTKDPQAVIWDELATVPLVFVVVPLVGTWTALAGFALHRLFDITKPWPCRALERLPGGWGIMADDVAAAVYAACVLKLVAWIGWL